MTDAAGAAEFATTGTRGTYKLTIDNVTKTAYTFDRAGSVLSGSIKK